jgi:hypothetical protein
MGTYVRYIKCDSCGVMHDASGHTQEENELRALIQAFITAPKGDACSWTPEEVAAYRGLRRALEPSCARRRAPDR